MIGWPLQLPGDLDFLNWYFILLALTYLPAAAVRVIRRLPAH